MSIDEFSRIYLFFVTLNDVYEIYSFAFFHMSRIPLPICCINFHVIDRQIAFNPEKKISE